MIAQARVRLGDDADLRVIDGPRLPVDDASVDLVLVSLVLHSVPRADAVGILREAARVLVPGGRVLVVDFGTSGLRFPRGWIGRGITVVAELAAGRVTRPIRSTTCGMAACQRWRTRPASTTHVSRPTAGGAITIAVLVPGRDFANDR